MTPVFADTSFYAALVNRRDQYHQRAKTAAADKSYQSRPLRMSCSMTANLDLLKTKVSEIIVENRPAQLLRAEPDSDVS